jgi:hypothetical protein
MARLLSENDIDSQHVQEPTLDPAPAGYQTSSASKEVAATKIRGKSLEEKVACSLPGGRYLSR